jgi:hypothetical protein
MTKRTFTSLIIRLAGIGLLIKLFDFLGFYFMTIYMTTQIWMIGDSPTKAEGFEKLYFSGMIQFFLHLFLVVVLLTLADWIAKKLVKSDENLKIDLTPKSCMSIVISTIGLLYLVRLLYALPELIHDSYRELSDPESTQIPYIIFILSMYAIRALIALVLILKVSPITDFLLRKMKLPE